MFNRRVDPRVMLHGYDLDEWDYLGFSRIQFQSEGKVTYEAIVHFFVDQSNRDIREYHIESNVADYFYENHTWITKCHLWAALQIGETTVVETWPSPYLRGVKAVEGFTWSDDKGWVASALTASAVDGNVITVDFNK
jgi:hypothetical protein